MEKPWLEYSGQTTTELLAAKESYRIDSILCALDDALQQKEGEWTPEERTVRAVMELDAQVHNGGFHQFFSNSSCEYAPEIVDCLRRIGSAQTADLAQLALETLQLPEVTEEAIQTAIGLPNELRDETLSELDRKFYDSYENEDHLFAFVEAHQAKILA